MQFNVVSIFIDNRISDQFRIYLLKCPRCIILNVFITLVIKIKIQQYQPIFVQIIN